MDIDLHVGEEGVEAEAVAPAVAGGVAGGGTVIINGGGAVGGVVGNGEEAARWEGGAAEHAEGGAINFAGGVVGGVVAPQQPEVQPMGEELKEATSNYIDELNRLTEMLTQVSEQSKRLTRDSEEMENLNRTLTGISRVYEMQLKSASAQISTIDEINEQTKHMAEQIQELNKIYARMIEAMQIKANI
jgi:archaellum component FlaC